MESRIERRLLIVWLFLSGISVLQLWLGSLSVEVGMAPNAIITCSVIGMALIKVRFIVREFMEVRHAPALLRLLTDGWIAITAIALMGVYLTGMVLN